MTNENYKISIDPENMKIEIVDLFSNKFTLDYSGDVAFTNFVMKLSEKMDSGDKINPEPFNNTSTEDEKAKLLISILKDIIGKYNEAIEYTPDSEDISLEF